MHRSRRWIRARAMVMALWGMCIGCSSNQSALTEHPGNARLVVSESSLDTENRYPEVVRVTTVLEGKTEAGAVECWSLLGSYSRRDTVSASSGRMRPPAEPSSTAPRAPRPRR